MTVLLGLSHPFQITDCCLTLVPHLLIKLTSLQTLNELNLINCLEAKSSFNILSLLKYLCVKHLTFPVIYLSSDGLMLGVRF